MTFALLASAVVALTVVPVMGAMLLRVDTDTSSVDANESAIQRLYTPMIRSNRPSSVHRTQQGRSTVNNDSQLAVEELFAHTTVEPEVPTESDPLGTDQL